MTFYWLVSCGQRCHELEIPDSSSLPLSRRCWHLTPTVDEVPVNPMLDYFENINIVKIIMEFQNLVDLDWLMAGALCPLDRLSLTN